MTILQNQIYNEERTEDGFFQNIQESKSTHMEHTKGGFLSIDEYIATFPADIQTLLEAMRAAIKAAAPDAKEIISYQMPAFALHGNLVYFAALKNHIGFYPTASGIAAFTDELSPYEGSKGAVKFPIGQPLPTELISKIVQFRVTENRNKAAAKAARKKNLKQRGEP